MNLSFQLNFSVPPLILIWLLDLIAKVLTFVDMEHFASCRYNSTLNILAPRLLNTPASGFLILIKF